MRDPLSLTRSFLWASAVALGTGPAAASLNFDPPVRIEQIPAAASGSYSIAVPDLDGDGRADVVAYANVPDPSGATPVPIALSRGPGFEARPTLRIDGAIVGFWAVAFDAAPGVDLVVHVRRGTPQVPVLDLLVYSGDGAGGFADPVELVMPSEDGRQVDLADLDADGDLDLVLFTRTTVVGADLPALMFVYRNDGGTLVLSDQRTISSLFIYVTTARLDGDAIPDLLFEAVFSNAGVQAMRGRGDGTFEDLAPDIVPGATAWRTARVVELDLDADGDRDLLLQGIPVGGVGPYLVHSFRREADGSLAARSFGLSWLSGSTRQQVADLDGDGALELAAANFASNEWVSTRWWDTVRVLADGGFGPTVRFEQTRGFDWDVAWADLDGDGRAEMLEAGYDGVRVRRGNAAANRAPVAAPTQSFTETQDRLLVGQVAASDADGHLISYRVARPPLRPASVAFYLDSAGWFRYDAGVGQHIVRDSFVVEVSDDTGATTHVTVEILPRSEGGGGTTDLALLLGLAAAFAARRARRCGRAGA